MSFINQNEIFKATDGGLDIILHYYPQASNCLSNNRKFKIRDTEKTASCTIRKNPKSGLYEVKDWGGDGKPKNAIGVVMDEANVDFKTAIQIIAERWNIAPEGRKTEILKPDIRQRDASAEEEEGAYTFEFGEYTEADLKTIFADQVIKYTQDKCALEQGTKKEDWIKKLSKLCESYYMYKCTSYSMVKDRRVTTISSTEQFPIFVFEIPREGGKKIRKIYQPLAADKSNRFRYETGKRPDDHIFGLSQAQKKYDGQNDTTPNKDADGNETKVPEAKLPEIILCTGGSDALNVAALGYQVVWFNSETAKVSGPQYYSISKLAEKICMLPDIDPTGKRAAHEFCMIYLDTRTIVLPPELSEKKDWRGNSCKDIRDYLRYWKAKDFDKLVEAALPYKFWDEVPQFNKKGDKVGINYDCNNTHLYWFLAQNGFYQFTNKNETDIYIQIVGNIVSEVDTKKIRKYINAFLSERNLETKLRNTFYRTTQLNASSFENLPHIKVDFTDFDKENQWLFFNNQTWQIKSTGITRYKPGEIFKYVWNKEVINHRVELLEDFFKIEQDGFCGYKIDVTNNDCILFKFIQRTCQMHWRVEELGVDDGQGGIRKTLTEDIIQCANDYLLMGQSLKAKTHENIH